jgi:hypothetical protein
MADGAVYVPARVRGSFGASPARTSPAVCPLADGGCRERHVPESERRGGTAGTPGTAAHGAPTAEWPRALTSTRACGELRRELGVYLLGAIAPADRSTVESHLASCAACRTQLADLAGLPALLRRVPPHDVARLVPAAESEAGSAPRDQPLGSLLSLTAKRRKRRVWLRLAVATAAGLAAGGAGTYTVLGTPQPRPLSLAPPAGITVRGSNPRTDASAVVTYARRPWGVQLSVQVKGIADGTRCVFEVTDTSGRESEAGSWTVSAGDGDTWYAASSSVPVTSVRGFVVSAGARTLVRVSVPVAPVGR